MDEKILIDDENINGCFRDLQEYLPQLAKFYLNMQGKRKGELKWFGETDGRFLVAIGGDGCPFGKNKSAYYFMRVLFTFIAMTSSAFCCNISGIASIDLERIHLCTFQFLFTDEVINGDSLISLTRKADEEEIFPKLGLRTFGKLVKFRKLIGGLLSCHEKMSRKVTATSTSNSSKPSMTEQASYGKDMQLLYKGK